MANKSGIYFSVGIEGGGLGRGRINPKISAVLMFVQNPAFGVQVRT